MWQRTSESEDSRINVSRTQNKEHTVMELKQARM